MRERGGEKAIKNKGQGTQIGKDLPETCLSRELSPLQVLSKNRVW